MVKASGKKDSFDTDPGLKTSSRYVDEKRFRDFQRTVNKDIGRLEDNKAEDSGVDIAQKLAEEAKEMAMAAKEKAMEPHKCTQVSTLDNLKEKITSGNKLKIGGLVSILIATAAFGVFLGVLKTSVADTRDDVSGISVKVEDNTDQISELKKSIDSNQEENKKAATVNLNELRSISAAIEKLPKKKK